MPLPIAPSFSVLNGTGQISVPVGVASWSVSVQSGSVVVNGAGPLIAPFSYASYATPSAAITVGTTGVGHKAVVTWEAPFAAAS